MSSVLLDANNVMGELFKASRSLVDEAGKPLSDTDILDRLTSDGTRLIIPEAAMAELQLGSEANFETLKSWIEANPDKAKIAPTELSIKDYE